MRDKNEVIDHVEVNNEPIHKELFKNQYTRLYLATLQPGERTLYHRHSEDTVYIVIQGGSIGTQDTGNLKRYPIDFPKTFRIFSKIRFWIRNLLTGSISMPNGFFFCMLHKKQPVIHRAIASNNNIKDIILMGIEIINKSDYRNQISLGKEFYQKDYESSTFSAFRMKLNAGRTTGYHTYDFIGLIIALEGRSCISTESRNIKLTSGEFLWLEYKTTLNISNIGEGRSFKAIIIAL